MSLVERLAELRRARAVIRPLRLPSKSMMEQSLDRASADSEVVGQ